MGKSISFSLIGCALTLFATICVLQNLKVTQDATTQRYLIPPPEQIEHFSFGFQESMADSLWLRWIQDNDVCQTYAGAQPKKAVPANAGVFSNPRYKFCDNSWSFKMLDAITRLAPKFKMPYEAGAITLTVITEDYEGAKIIFDRAIQAYPDDWSILYRASYHYMFDRNDLPKAAELLSRAGRLGGPYWLNLLAARLYSKNGQLELGINTLTSFKATIKDNPKMLEQTEKRIAELQRQLKELPAKGP